MSIKEIDKSTVHRICSGQVVLNLAIAVKELVENSLDANASNIEICLTENGIELIQVIDNGTGIEVSNFREIGAKHSTSKIEDFSDLNSVETFGFRGEALSSLCALSKVSITTRHATSNVGYQLDISHNGTILKQTPVARSIGTTVSLQNLFAPLSVRFKEFQRNIKKEVAKMVRMLTSYCLICPNVKFTCSNYTGKKTVLLSTPGDSTIKDIIACIFGSKQVSSVVAFEMCKPSHEIKEEYSLSENSIESECRFKIEGYVSTCEHGEGRSTTDRQFIFINNRPCKLPKVAKIVNEVYHSYNRHQYPFLLLNISLNRDAIDVNVTPDKRTVFIEHEKLVVATTKASLLKLYEHVPSTMNQSIISFLEESPKLNTSQCNNDRTCTIEVDFTKLKRKTSPLTNSQSESKLCKIEEEPNSQIEIVTPPNDGCVVSGNSSPSSSISSLRNSPPGASQINSSATRLSPLVTPMDKLLSFHRFQGNRKTVEKSKNDKLRNATPFSNMFLSQTSRRDLKNDVVCLNLEESLANDDEICEIENREVKTVTTVKVDYPKQPKSPQFLKEMKRNCNDVEILGARNVNSRKQITLHFSMESLRTNNKSKTENKLSRQFRAKISQDQNNNAEEELKRELRKDQFEKMEIIGQFNLGFIITKLDFDLFIIDQHATDEKYNYENLRINTVLETQKLFLPQKLHFSAVSESIIIDNLDIFNMNGFHFNIDNDAKTGEKVSLAAIPVSKNCVFGKSDIEELVFMLSDCIAKGAVSRPSKLNAMFAMRACRKSIKIGTTLSKSDMRKLVLHMGEIDQPWNCPHGRPTIRHLVNLQLASQTT